MRLFQYLTMVLMSTYHHAELTRSASVSALHDLFHVIISILLEPKMEQLADGAQLLRYFELAEFYSFHRELKK